MCLQQSLSTLIFLPWNFTIRPQLNLSFQNSQAQGTEKMKHTPSVIKFRENNAFLPIGVYFPLQGSNDKFLKNYGTDYAI